MNNSNHSFSPQQITHSELSPQGSFFVIEIGGVEFKATKPHAVGIIITGAEGLETDDYLHDFLLLPENRDSFFELIEREGLVVCKDVHSYATSYRKVRGKSSHGKLSQAEYYHHDGCSCPTKPRIVEIRMPHQPIERNIATAIAPFPSVIKAMVAAIPNHVASQPEFANLSQQFEIEGRTPPAETCDKIQGQLTRLVRRELDAESCRAYFRDVDLRAGAFVEPWEMGESRLMLNDHDDLTKTMQHRRSYQKPRGDNEQNGSLVKRWTAEET